MKTQRDTNSWFKYDLTLKTPLTTTQDMLRSGTKKQQQRRIITRKQLNFMSYPMNDFRLDEIKFEKFKEKNLVSSYCRDFMEPYEARCRPLHEKKTKMPDWQMNRRPLNEFDARAGRVNKFMDDHFINLTPQRRKANFFRQLRNQS